MSTLDGNWGYWKIPQKKSDRDYTSFLCRAGTYLFNLILFGLISAPVTFLRALYIVLVAYKCQSCLVYLDDILVFSKNADSNLKHLEQILAALHISNVTIKLKKYSILTQRSVMSVT